MLVVIIMGSPSDAEFAKKITRALDELGIPWETRVASAHKVPRYVLEMIEAYEADPQPRVYITVAGRSNALSGLVDAQVSAPVIACPPYSDKFAGGDVYSSLRMPSGVAPAVVLEPENAALLAAKMLGLADAGLRAKIQEAQKKQRQRLLEADAAQRADAAQKTAAHQE
ncbi:MAG: AIR carboxylase family protein [Anaerolineae bacterium]|nr:AIR carboxylase family protein [Anaerolineae bacterium]